EAQEAPVQQSDPAAGAIVEDVVPAEGNHVLLEAEEPDAALVNEAEGEVLREPVPVIGRALDGNELLVIVGVEREYRHRQSARPDGLLQGAPEHQVHGGAPIEVLAEQLEHQALVEALFFVPQVLAIADEAGALAALDDLREDVHVGGELARLGLVAAPLVEA